MHSIIKFIKENDFHLTRNTAVILGEKDFPHIEKIVRECTGQAVDNSDTYIHILFKDLAIRTVGMMTLHGYAIYITFRENEIYYQASIPVSDIHYAYLHNRAMSMIGQMSEEKAVAREKEKARQKMFDEEIEEKRRDAAGVFEYIKNQNISSTFKPTPAENVHDNINDKDVNSAYWNRMGSIKFDDNVTKVCMSALNCSKT